MERFELNSKIELITEVDGVTQGLIHDIIDDKLYVSITSDDKKFKLLYVGDSVSCLVFQDMSCIAFDGTITNRIAGDFPIYEISEMNNFFEVQRRQDVRVPCSIPIFYSKNEYLLNLDIERVEEGLERIKKYLSEGIMIDLSGGGLKLTTQDNFNMNQNLLFVINIDNNSMIVRGNILHKTITPTPNKTVFSYGIQLLNIDEQQRDRIIRFLFVLMRKNRLK